jgi:hypothetical protein
MLEFFSKRDIAILVVAFIILCALSAGGSVFVINHYVIGERDDPLARAGGLKPEQAIGIK